MKFPWRIPHKQRGGVRIDTTVSLSHLMSLLAFMVSLMLTWNTLDKRVLVLEEAKKSQATLDAAQDQRSSEKFSEVRETLTEIKRGIEKVNDKLEARK